jgi:hypothetical protein
MEELQRNGTAVTTATQQRVILVAISARCLAFFRPLRDET